MIRRWIVLGFTLLLLLFLAAAPAAADHDHAMGASDSTAQGPPPLYNDLGTLHHAVTTSNPQAQKYFDQGLRLVYGFNHDEAVRAFQEAARLDSTCAMAYWGEAYALGPNINVPMDSTLEPRAYELTRRALVHARTANESDRQYIEALAKRYAPQGSTDRSARDRAYADAMRQLARRLPGDPDAQVLFAESMLDLNPWNQWTQAGKPNPGTLEIVATLERVLKKHPDHPGAIHYYIHAVEASPRPERAIPYAERLPEIIPGAGHLVHMPSHLYRLVGRWNDSKTLNQRAAEVDDRYIAAEKPSGLYPVMYRNHNVHFVAYSAATEGNSAEALRYARDLYDHVPSELVAQMPMAELFPPWPLLVLIRFGRWEDIQKEPAPPPHYHYTTGIWHYARGLAFTHDGELEKAAVERDSVEATAAPMSPDFVVGFNSAKTLLGMASKVLAGEMAARQKRYDEAERVLRQAVAMEDSLHYDEPPTWYFPVRQNLGAVLLEAGKPAQAEAVYRQDLKHNPRNGWSLYGLEQCLKARRATKDAATVEAQFKKAWTNADVTLTSSRF